jgi:hypothetical protein
MPRHLSVLRVHRVKVGADWWSQGAAGLFNFRCSCLYRLSLAGFQLQKYRVFFEKKIPYVAQIFYFGKKFGFFMLLQTYLLVLTAFATKEYFIEAVS